MRPLCTLCATVTPEAPAETIPNRQPLVVWTLVALNVVIYLWDRQFNPFGTSATFADLAMHPREVVESVRHLGFPLATIFTSMFLHGGLMHIIGNLVFLTVFGPGVEQAIGGARFALYYIAWGVAAAAAQIWVDPYTSVPTLGASGAIGGVLGAYFLLFPSSRLEILIPFLEFETPAWILLGGWFLFQILARQEGVANWAHAGGFLAGMATVLVLGGRMAVLKGRPDLLEY